MHTQQSNNFLEQIDQYRLIAGSRIDERTKSEWGQYFTPNSISEFMASLFKNLDQEISLLDPGAGIGSLSAAFVNRYLHSYTKELPVTITCYEKDTRLINALEDSLNLCKEVSLSRDIHLDTEIINKDFIHEGAKNLNAENGLFPEEIKKYTHCILNPPYQKINNDSQYRRDLRSAGIETSNLYTGFLALSIMLLEEGGEIVAIIPRSFCNGVYFKKFRNFLLSKLNLLQIHVFDDRNKAFKDDEVLQENIIIHGVKEPGQSDIKITSSEDSSFSSLTERVVSPESVILPDDPEQFIHVTTNDFDQMVVDNMSVFKNSLSDLGLNVSTGPVVDFRLKDCIQQLPTDDSYPLIYPSHLENGSIVWPKPNGKKANAIKLSDKSRPFLMKNGWYVLTKRFSSKEEKRRIYASEFNPILSDKEFIGFENHLNIIHKNKSGLDEYLARGLKTYLNSTLVDLYFRQYSGHTQVNASDFKKLKFPNPDVLREIGEKATNLYHHTQQEVDALLESIIDRMANKKNKSASGVKKKIEEALEILEALDLPKAQKNERSALTLLALVDIKPGDNWQDASEPLIGITPIMDFIKEHYGRNYAPNTRETIRRQTMHQFVDAGIAIANPDEPGRPINSPHWVYQIESNMLELIKSYGTSQWDQKASEFLQHYQSLAERYAARREMNTIPLQLGDKKISLTPGAHSELIKNIVEEFGPRFAPGGKVLYVGDTGSKLTHFDEAAFTKLGLEFDSHGKFPDVVIYYEEKNWLFLIEAVTSHGPVDPKRHSELQKLFSNSQAGLIYVTALPDKYLMARYIPEISWETEVWVAESPEHLIHFDGKRFLGPY